MSRHCQKDEHLERLWYMKEEGKTSIDELKNVLPQDFSEAIVDELFADGLVELREDGAEIALTPEGEKCASKLIRAHRLAERLLYDVLGGEFESVACEFEHMVTLELVDSICTLLGHPRECPHGLPIPEGECCRRSARTACSSIAPLTELEVGQSARVAYVNCRDDQRLHKINGLHIRPGAVVKLHQTYPSYVIECEGANIALDKEIAFNICVWREPWQFASAQQENPDPGRGKGIRFRARGRGQ